MGNNIESERDALAHNRTWEELDPCDVPRDRKPLRAIFVFNLAKKSRLMVPFRDTDRTVEWTSYVN